MKTTPEGVRMSYVTLTEALQIIQSEAGIDATVNQLIRAAAHQAFPLCVLLDEECYSPTKASCERKVAESADPEYWTSSKVADAVANYGKPNATAYGLFALAPRDVFAFQTKNCVRISSAWSLDGADIYFLYKEITKDELQIPLAHLKQFIEANKERVSALDNTRPEATEEEMEQGKASAATETNRDTKAGASNPCAPADTPSQSDISNAPTGPKAKKKWDEYELRRLLDASREPGVTHAKLASRYGVTRQCIAKYVKKAKELFSPAKATMYSPLMSNKRK